jgi:hypothetical protein
VVDIQWECGGRDNALQNTCEGQVFVLLFYKGVISCIPNFPGVLVGLVVYCGRGAMWLGRRRCYTRASGFCVEVLPVDICTVSAVGSMVIVCGEGVKTKCVLTCLSGYHIGSGLSCEVWGLLWNVPGSGGV